MYTKFQSENLISRDHVGETRVDGGGGDNINMDFKGASYENVEWIHLALVNTGKFIQQSFL
jgi:hypothetical protein